MTDIGIFGAGGHGLSVRAAAHSIGLKPRMFDDGVGKTRMGEVTVDGSLTDFMKVPEGCIAIGNNEKRRDICERVSKSVKLTSIIHATATLTDDVIIGAGSVVLANSVINAFVEVGRGSIINTSAVVEHGCRLGDYCHISPGAVLCGDVSVGQRVWIGAGAVIKEGITIEDGAIIGAGSVVLRDVPTNSIIVGNPGGAKRVRR
jgi:sugar O-acyltransferase (sialic acid O-acetyltransferase NeuD family)